MHACKPGDRAIVLITYKSREMSLAHISPEITKMAISLTPHTPKSEMNRTEWRGQVIHLTVKCANDPRRVPAGSFFEFVTFLHFFQVHFSTWISPHETLIFVAAKALQTECDENEISPGKSTLPWSYLLWWWFSRVITTTDVGFQRADILPLNLLLVFNLIALRDA